MLPFLRTGRQEEDLNPSLPNSKACALCGFPPWAAQGLGLLQEWLCWVMPLTTNNLTHYVAHWTVDGSERASSQHGLYFSGKIPKAKSGTIDQCFDYFIESSRRGSLTHPPLNWHFSPKVTVFIPKELGSWLLRLPPLQCGIMKWAWAGRWDELGFRFWLSLYTHLSPTLMGQVSPDVEG